MRRCLNLLLIATLGGTLLADHAAAQFNPRGRKPKKPPSSRAHSPAKPRSPGARAPKPKAAPTSAALIKRYTAIVLNQPGAQFPLERLAQLYRERDGNLDQLLSEFEARVANEKAASSYNLRVALSGLYKQAGRYQAAISGYNDAIGFSPKNPIAVLALARLHQDRGNKQEAKTLFDRALPLLTVGADREQTLRQLMSLSLDLRMIPEARTYHLQLLKRAKGSFFVRAELGRQLLARELFEAAEVEFKDVVKAAAGDNRALAPALRDLGRSQAKQDKHQAALSTLRRGLRITSRGSGLRRELFELIVGVYRDQERLPELIALLESEGASDFQQLRLLGRLYEESGRIRDAMKTYRKALKRNSKDLEVRLKVVQLLQIQGDLDAAIVEYQALIKAAPHNPDYVFQLAEALLQQGDRRGALKHLLALERRSRGDDQTLAALVDFYERVGEAKRGFVLLERLAKAGARDPQPIIELGDRYYQEGNNEKAKRTWQRLLTAVPGRARAWSMLGDVYLEHDMTEEALMAFEEAIKLAPDNKRHRKALALALERSAASESQGSKRARYEKARRIWEQLLLEAKEGDRLAQEARQHIVTLWSLGGTMQMRIPPLRRNLSATPPDLNSGRLLAEIFTRMRRYREAERALLIVVKHAPGDVPSQLRLERVLVLQRKLGEAISVLEGLTRLNPKRAREYYQRMAQYAAELYRDDDAIRFASKAVELSPDDAIGHQKLGDMYRRRQDTARAINQYRKAIAKNDRLFPVYFDLAELLLSDQETAGADRLLRRVMRAAVDEDLVMRATRLSMQINLGQGTLESLEKELLPVALANPQRPVYRRLLVELYGAVAFPLIQKAKSTEPGEREKARVALSRIGQRAVKPLLDALGDERHSQQSVAVELLTKLATRSSSAALFAFAVGEKESSLRVRAMIAAGVARDPELLPRYEQLLFEGQGVRVDDGDPVTLAAVWGLVQLRGQRARERTLQLLTADSEVARALSAVALGRAQVQAAEKPLLQMLNSVENGHLSRAAACFALGELGSRASIELLKPLSERGDARVRSAALVALTRLTPSEAKRAIAEALFSERRQLREAGLSAAAVLGSGTYPGSSAQLPIPDGHVRVEPILTALQPSSDSKPAIARALLLLEAELSEAAVRATEASMSGARLTANLVLADGKNGRPGPLGANLSSVSGALRTRALSAVSNISLALVPAFLNLSVHPAEPARITALKFLATRTEPAARNALLTALQDPEPQVQRLAIALAARNGEAETAVGLVGLLKAQRPWPIRMLLAESLSAYGDAPAFHNSPQKPQVVAALVKLAQKDDYSLVREAAMKSLAKLDWKAAKPVLQALSKTDPERTLQLTAAALLANPAAP